MDRRNFCHKMGTGLAGLVAVPGTQFLDFGEKSFSVADQLLSLKTFHTYFTQPKDLLSSVVREGRRKLLNEPTSIKPYLFVLNDWDLQEKRLFLDAAQGRRGGKLNTARTVINLYFDEKNANNRIKAYKIQSFLSQSHFKLNLVPENNRRFWSSWQEKRGLFLMDWVSAESSDLVTALCSSHSCSKLSLKHARMNMTRPKDFLKEFHTFSARVTI
jgi:hypothetical protein